MVYMTAKVSGGKLNPAVSLGLLVSGSISAPPLASTHASQFRTFLC
jgi:glycerol uptake facilitator-like aquaporin